ncbi:MAG: hypothetical protein Q8R98_16540, partial [Rubrivivax sp.]|nr:hypothetical protein [Rubrivivax sp.]
MQLVVEIGIGCRLAEGERTVDECAAAQAVVVPRAVPAMAGVEADRVRAALEQRARAGFSHFDDMILVVESEVWQ